MMKNYWKMTVLSLCTAVLMLALPIFAVAKPKNLNKSIKVGETVYFGNYEQDGDEDNGKEKIEWIVLDKKKNKVLLISKDILHVIPYNLLNTGIEWERCVLRKWLNNDFAKEAFTAKENKKIEKSEIKNKENKKYHTSGGGDTVDKIFPLSIEEAEKYFKKDEKRAGKVNEYGIKKIAKSLNKSEDELKEKEFSESNNWYWWLRSPGILKNNAAAVEPDGSVNLNGYIVIQKKIGVRPAIWLKL